VLSQAGYDPVWFGILVVIPIETAMITPPVGSNLFVVQGIRRRGSM
jgi:C4-dicarboxylate transporter DctM subunit